MLPPRVEGRSAAGCNLLPVAGQDAVATLLLWHRRKEVRRAKLRAEAEQLRAAQASK